MHFNDLTRWGSDPDFMMSMESYEKSLAQLDLYRKLAEAEAQIKNGEELLDGEEVFKTLKKKYEKQ
ncbi:hypothetical protein BKP45_08725 [Anaerobacillus alkalidiazotrophicus]|uniref:Uncharacterized protein n=2 Tax=Anaerobacillus alkalidiazotrophicus TaxID=472963 RepID=A0A1S2M7C8_9BACI|nr:hypothetical protein BKP45_08725 [Anaerobacillus alkalidiazotrophicus]